MSLSRLVCSVWFVLFSSVAFVMIVLFVVFDVIWFACVRFRVTSLIVGVVCCLVSVCVGVLCC